MTWTLALLAGVSVFPGVFTTNGPIRDGEESNERAADA